MAGTKLVFEGDATVVGFLAHTHNSRGSPRESPSRVPTKTRVSLSASRRNGLCFSSSPFVYCVGSLGCIHTIRSSLVQGRTPHIFNRDPQTPLNASLARRRIKSSQHPTFPAEKQAKGGNASCAFYPTIDCKKLFPGFMFLFIFVRHK